ncbi:MMPL family transporter [Nocardioides fonticola]|uniref:MMPL family transporter n=1 Tax=Nocardioides fonticola TaxID=450363 RepID=A0ABP7XAQ4_9ACTN
MHRQIAGRLAGKRTAPAVVVLAFILVGLLAPLAAKLADVQNNEASSWLPGSAESTEVSNELSSTVDPNDIPTLIVYDKPGGLSDADKQAITAQATDLAKIDGVTGQVLTPEQAAALGFGGYSQDGEVAVTALTFNFGKNGWNDIPDAADKIREITKMDGVTVHLAGFGGQAADASEAFGGLDTTLLLATFGIVILILLFTYRSPILWILPIFCAGLSLQMSEGLIYLLAKHAGLTVNGQSQAILSILVIGAGTDYALLLIARYREELRRHESRHEAMAFALHRAAPAILASAATVAVGMLCLLAADLNSTAGLGPVNAIGVLVTVVVMVTVLPALLVIFGRWIFWPKRPTFGSEEPTASGLWARVGAAISPRPRRVWVGTAIVLGIACLGLVKLDTAGLSTADSYTKEFDSIKGQKVLVEHGLLDNSNTVQVVSNADSVGAVAKALQGVSGLGTLTDPRPVSADRVYVEAPIDADISSPKAFGIVDAARDAVHAVPDADALVGGGSAFYVDTKTASERDNKVIIPLVLIVVLLILIGLLRAVAAPLILLATVVLSFGAALGISALIFTYVFGFAGADPGFPLFTFVFLVALGIDYNIFLMTRVREETLERGTREGSLIALSSTGGVITSAGLVLAATFAVLGTLPLVFLAELGTAVALGVLLDTIIVRSVLVTAINLDLGDRIWWPSKLARGEHGGTQDGPLAEASAARVSLTE